MFFMLAVWLWGSVVYTGSAASNTTPIKTHYVAFGDSLTAGYEPGLGIEDGKSIPYGFVDRVYEQALYYGRAELHNYGLAGLRTDGLLNYIQAIVNAAPITGDEIQPELVDFRADDYGSRVAEAKKNLEEATLITISIGGNDFADLLIASTKMTEEELQIAKTEKLKTYETRLTETLRLIRTVNTTAKIMIADQYQPVQNSPTTASYYTKLSALAKEISTTLDDIVKANQSSGAIAAVPIREAFIGNEFQYTYFFPDRDIHPKQPGYDAMGKVFAESIWGSYKKPVGTDFIRVIAAGKEIQSVYKPLNINNNTLLVLKDITDALGAKIRWDAKIKSTIVEYNGKTVQLKAGANYFLLNGVKQTITSKATVIIHQQKTYVPLRLLVEGLGFDVQYSVKSKTAFVNK